MNEPNIENSSKTIIETFRIIPTSQSILGRMILIVILFLTYILFVGWIAIFDSKITPNMSLFLDFIFDKHEKSILEFQNYIKNILNNFSESESFENFVEPEPEIINSKTQTQNINSISPFYKTISELNLLITDIIKKITDILETGFQRFLLMIHLRGNKIFVNKSYIY